MPRLADHTVQFGVFVALFAVATVLGFTAAGWRRPDTPPDLEQWGLGGRAFGNWVTWFLVGGDVYTAYTFVAVPALVYAAGAYGYFAVPFAVVTYPLIYLPLSRLWSVAHTHGFITPAELVRARFGSRGLGAAVALAGITATMPYIAVQLIGLRSVLTVLGLPGGWPLTAAFAVLAVFTFRSGLRAPALISILKDVLILWTVLAAVVAIAMTAGGIRHVFHLVSAARPGALLLSPDAQLGYVTLVLGSALGLLPYPHVMTGFLAARNRLTVKRNLAALPVYTLMLGIVALLGYVALAAGVRPVGGDPNTVVPALFDVMFPAWCAGLAFAAIGIGALVPAAIMSIAAANLFTRGIYRPYLRPHASAAEETTVSRLASLSAKLGAVVVIVALNPRFAIDLQLIGGVVILQTLPALAIGLYTSWAHRYALGAGLLAGLGCGLAMLYQIPQPGPGGRAHFGGSAWPLAHLGLHTHAAVYAGLVALAVNAVVVFAGTVLLRGLRVPAGVDLTVDADFEADEADGIDRLVQLVDGTLGRRPAHLR